MRLFKKTNSFQATILLKRVLPVFFMVLSSILFIHGTNCYCSDNSDSNEQLLQQFIKAIGSNIITFDCSNIKQFWTDKSVISRNGNIEILLNETKAQIFNGVPLKIQLANVEGFQTCNIDIISTEKDFDFLVSDIYNKPLETSCNNSDFINYNIIRKSFHFEDIVENSFCIQFNSSVSQSLAIKNIVLSFTPDSPLSSFVARQKFVFSSDDVSAFNSKATSFSEDSFSVTGKRSSIISKQNIILSSNSIVIAAKIKNTGNVPAQIFLGCAPYTEDNIRLDGRNYPYNNMNTILRVVSAKAGENTVVVDRLPAWKANYHMALNADENLDDIPNVNLVEGQIAEAKQLSNGQWEITFNKALKEDIKAGTKTRIHGATGAYLGETPQKLLPGEEKQLVFKVKKDNSFLEFSPSKISRGTSYIKPLILSNSLNSDSENTVVITDFIVYY